MNYKYFSGWRLLMMNGWQLMHYSVKTVRGDLTPTLFFKALRDYQRQKKTVGRQLSYNKENLQRYFFVSRKAVCSPEQIGQIGFLQYFFSGLRRFL